MVTHKTISMKAVAKSFFLLSYFCLGITALTASNTVSSNINIGVNDSYISTTNYYNFGENRLEGITNINLNSSNVFQAIAVVTPCEHTVLSNNTNTGIANNTSSIVYLLANPNLKQFTTQFLFDITSVSHLLYPSTSFKETASFLCNFNHSSQIFFLKDKPCFSTFLAIAKEVERLCYALDLPYTITQHTLKVAVISDS